MMRAWDRRQGDHRGDLTRGKIDEFSAGVAKWHRWSENGTGRGPLRWCVGRSEGKMRRWQRQIGDEIMDTKKIAVVAVLCAVVALVACRREERYEPLKLGGPTAEQPAR